MRNQEVSLERSINTCLERRMWRYLGHSNVMRFTCSCPKARLALRHLSLSNFSGMGHHDHNMNNDDVDDGGGGCSRDNVNVARKRRHSPHNQIINQIRNNLFQLQFLIPAKGPPHNLAYYYQQRPVSTKSGLDDGEDSYTESDDGDSNAQKEDDYFGEKESTFVEYANIYRTKPEWEVCTRDILEKVQFDSYHDFYMARAVMLYWANEGTNKDYQTVFTVFGHLAMQAKLHPELIPYQWTRRHSDPPVTFMLNHILDRWKYRWLEQESDVLSPIEMRGLIEALDEDIVQLNSRSYVPILIGALNHPGSIVDVPAFCESALEAVLRKTNARPGIDLITLVIRSWVTTDPKGSIERVESLWENTLLLLEKSMVRGRLNKNFFNEILTGLVQSEDPRRVQHAAELVRNLDVETRGLVSSDADMYKKVLFGWVQLAVDSWKKGESAKGKNYILHAMKTLRETERAGLCADATFFSVIISAIAKYSKDPEDYVMAMKLFKHLEEKYQKTQDKAYVAESFTMRAMIILFSKAGHPDAAHSLLIHLESLSETLNNEALLPKPGHYVDVITGWYKSELSESAERITDLILRMCNNVTTKGLLQYCPDDDILSITFRCVVRNPNLMDAVYGKLLEVYKLTGGEVIKPKTGWFLSAMHAWSMSQSDEALTKVRSLYSEFRVFQRHLSIRFFRSDYKRVMRFLLDSGPTEVSEDAVNLIQNALAEFRLGNDIARPDAALYDLALEACTNAGDGERAEIIYQYVWDDWNKGNSRAKPNPRMAHAVLTSWLHPTRVSNESLERAIAFFRKLRLGQLPMDALCCDVLLNALGSLPTYPSRTELIEYVKDERIQLGSTHAVATAAATPSTATSRFEKKQR